MSDLTDVPRGKVPMYPPNGGQEPTFFLERHVSQQLTRGWTLEAAGPKPQTRRAITRKASTPRATAPTDKPEQQQGTEENS